VAGTAVALVWLLGQVLLPFVAAMAVGYVLDPLVQSLSRRGVPRALAAGVLVLGSYVLGITALVLGLPVLVRQGRGIVARLPEYASAAYDAVRPILRTFGADGPPPPLGDALERHAGPLSGLAADLLGRSLALVNLGLLLALTPLVAFYLLRDWPRIVAEIDAWLPRRHAAAIRGHARAIDDVLAGFVRGTVLVSLALAAFYAIGLTALGVEFGFLIGLLAGAVSVVPYAGTLVGLLASTGMALHTFGARWGPLAAVVAVFVLGQLLADYVLTPKLVGDRIRLHPVWVIFAVLAGGTVAGVVGMLVAVPAAAAIGVLARAGLERYRASTLYLS
jgi:predicted PurR-regulated permease PerM